MLPRHSLPRERILTLNLSLMVKGQGSSLELLKGEKEDRMNDQGLTLERLANLTWRIGV